MSVGFRRDEMQCQEKTNLRKVGIARVLPPVGIRSHVVAVLHLIGRRSKHVLRFRCLVT